MIRDYNALLKEIRAIHAAIRDTIVNTIERQHSEPAGTSATDDAIFAFDRHSTQLLLEHFGALARKWPLVLIAKGLGPNGRAVLPAGTRADQAELRVIVDPVDGTRGLMYQKRPAWTLTGVAPNRGPLTSLVDVELAVMTEIPLIKQHLSDQLWAVVDQGVKGERANRFTGETQPLAPRPSRASSIVNGYGSIARFFPGARDVLAAVEEDLVDRLLGPQPAGQALVYEDQYISTGGQLYELLMGHDRWVADLRPVVEPILRDRGRALGLCCNPDDICVELIAREAGVIVADAHGHALDALLDVSSEVAWVGYANHQIYRQVTPVLRELMIERGLLPKPATPPAPITDGQE